MKRPENNQKIKLLKIMEILQQESDEDSPIRTSEFCRRLREMKITCDTRTLGKDMRFLNEQGYEILYKMIGHEKAYYVMDRSFSVPELKVLIDAVQAANFITEKKTAELTDKIAALGGSYRAEILKGNIVRFNTRKHSNEAVWYTVDALEQALLQGKKVSFYYFSLNENHERVYRYKKHRYTEDPVALVYNEDNYYLMCFNLKWGNITNYRVDRMAEVRVEEEGIDRRTRQLMKKLDIGGYTEAAFRMYAGEPKKVKLRFRDDLIAVVYDKFGEGVKMKRIGGDLIEAFVRVQVSTTFFGWVCQFPGSMEVIWPPSVVSEFRGYADNVNRIRMLLESRIEPVVWVTDEEWERMEKESGEAGGDGEEKSCGTGATPGEE